MSINYSMSQRVYTLNTWKFTWYVQWKQYWKWRREYMFMHEHLYSYMCNMFKYMAMLTKYNTKLDENL